jgi:hypothetical protein
MRMGTTVHVRKYVPIARRALRDLLYSRDTAIRGSEFASPASHALRENKPFIEIPLWDKVIGLAELSNKIFKMGSFSYRSKTVRVRGHSWVAMELLAGRYPDRQDCPDRQIGSSWCPHMSQKCPPGDFWPFWSPRKVATGDPLELARRGGPEMIEGGISRPL